MFAIKVHRRGDWQWLKAHNNSTGVISYTTLEEEREVFINKAAADRWYNALADIYKDVELINF